MKKKLSNKDAKRTKGGAKVKTAVKAGGKAKPVPANLR